MSQIRDDDFDGIQRFLRRIYACRQPLQLAERVITTVPELVGSDQTTWNVVAPSIPRADAMAWPPSEAHQLREASLARHAREHPLVVHFFTTGDTSVHKISDFMSEREFHRTALYDELYRPLGYEDQFSVNLRPPGPEITALVVARGDRNFTERDRAVLEFIRPHLAQAWRNARAWHRLCRRLERDIALVPRQTRIELGADGTIVRYPSRAQRWICAYFDDLPRNPRRLPDTLDRWLADWRRRPGGPLVRTRGDRRLVVHADPAGADGSPVLLMEEQKVPGAAHRLRGKGLTRREVGVLRHVERGLTNLEIATELGVSASTVKRHLENIYGKLGVPNRAAAAARLRG